MLPLRQESRLFTFQRPAIKTSGGEIKTRLELELLFPRKSLQICFNGSIHFHSVAADIEVSEVRKRIYNALKDSSKARKLHHPNHFIPLKQQITSKRKETGRYVVLQIKIF